MLILGIETSCDETAAALVENGGKIISNVVASSQELHIKTKGVIPEVAAREQVTCLIPVIKETILNMQISKYANKQINKQINKYSNDKIKKSEDLIDAIAVTVGPGLIGSLLVGVETAKTLAYVWNKPIIPVNHLIGHIYTNFVNILPCHSRESGNLYQYRFQVKSFDKAQDLPGMTNCGSINFKEIFPAVVLIVSGGHTELLLMTDHAAPAYATRKRCGRGKFQWLGSTRDDAAGECFDKCARILGLPYPGGPSIEKEAKKFAIRNSQFAIKLPRPMIDQDNFDFSFSGLKTALFNKVKISKNVMLNSFQHPQGIPKRVRDDITTISLFAYEVQEAITDVLVKKTIHAAEKFSASWRIKSIILGGGVVANQRLREKFKEKAKNFLLLMPEKSLSTDNAVGIASAAFFNFESLPWRKITAEPGLEIV